MKKEQLKQYVKDQALLQVIGQKMDTEDTRRKLYAASDIATETNLSKTVRNEIEAKIELLSKISRSYSIMLEDVWGISWQAEDIIKRYMHLSDSELDALPDVLKN